MYSYSGENKYLKFTHLTHSTPLTHWPLAKKCVIYNCNGRCILTVRNRISTNKSRKLHFITFIYLYLMQKISICTPKQTARILAPNDQLCAQEAHRLVLIRPNKVHLISTGDVYKRNL